MAIFGPSGKQRLAQHRAALERAKELVRPYLAQRLGGDEKGVSDIPLEFRDEYISWITQLRENIEETDPTEMGREDVLDELLKLVFLVETVLSRRYLPPFQEFNRTRVLEKLTATVGHCVSELSDPHFVLAQTVQGTLSACVADLETATSWFRSAVPPRSTKVSQADAMRAVAEGKKALAARRASDAQATASREAKARQEADAAQALAASYARPRPLGIGRCGSCSQESEPDARFCPACGSVIIRPCACGTSNKPSSRFCKGCGRPLVGQAGASEDTAAILSAALARMGYKQHEIDRTLVELGPKLAGTTLPELVREALALLSR